MSKRQIHRLKEIKQQRSINFPKIQSRKLTNPQENLKEAHNAALSLTTLPPPHLCSTLARRSYLAEYKQNNYPRRHHYSPATLHLYCDPYHALYPSKDVHRIWKARWTVRHPACTGFYRHCFDRHRSCENDEIPPDNDGLSLRRSVREKEAG